MTPDERKELERKISRICGDTANLASSVMKYSSIFFDCVDVMIEEQKKFDRLYMEAVKKQDKGK